MTRRILINDILFPLSLNELNSLPINEETDIMLCNIGMIQDVSYKDTILSYHAINATTSRGLCEIHELFDKLDATEEFTFTIKRTPSGFNLYRKNNWGLMSAVANGTTDMLLQTTANGNLLFLGCPSSPLASGGQLRGAAVNTATDISVAINDDTYHWKFDASSFLHATQSNGLDVYFRIPQSTMKADTSPKTAAFIGNSTTGYYIRESENKGNYACLSYYQNHYTYNAAGQIYWNAYHIGNIQPNKAASGSNVVWDDAQTMFALSTGDVSGTIPNHSQHVIRFAQNGSYLTYSGDWSYDPITANGCWFVFKKM